MDLQDHFSEVSSHFSSEMAAARFYPYKELKHTWTRQGNQIEFRISDYLRGSSNAVLESLAWYLLSRAHARRCEPDKSRYYLARAFSPALWEPVRDLYMSRQKNLVCNPLGEARNLEDVFRYVNSFYFFSKIRDPILAWSRESPRTRLGFYFAPLGLLAANKALDAERVPRYVLEFVMYHELLHNAECEVRDVESRRIHHTRSFRQRERAFSHFNEAESWLRRLANEATKR